MTARRPHIYGLIWLLAIAALAVVYAYVGSWRIGHGFFSPATRFIADHAVAALHGTAPFENLALVYPPLPIIIFALLGSPTVASIVLCVVATTAVLWIAIRYTNDPLTAVLLSVAVLTPAITLTALEFPAAWLFAAMLAWAIYNLARYTEREYSVYLFQAGMIIAIGIFVDLRMAAFALVVSFILFIEYARKAFWQGVSVALVLIFPVVFFYLSWNYAQWVFTGKFGFLVPPVGLRPFWQTWPIGAAYIFSLLCLAISPRATVRRYLLAVCASPAIIVLVAAATGASLGAGGFALIGLAFSIVTITQIGNPMLRRVAALVTLAGAIGLRYTLPPLATEMFDLDPVQTIPAHVVTHYVWESWVFGVRIALAIILAILTVLLARHSLQKLTGEAQTS